MKKLLLALLLLFSAPIFVTSVLAAPIEDTFADPQMEARAHALQRQLRCLVCQGQSIDDSGADLAGDLRHLVRSQMRAGRSDQEIKDYLVARYGDFILMQPPLQADTWLLWLAPFLVLGGAGSVAAWVICRARIMPETQDPNASS
jgi:cytochrome c-type biogenesis protein CcmH